LKKIVSVVRNGPGLYIQKNDEYKYCCYPKFLITVITWLC